MPVHAGVFMTPPLSQIWPFSYGNRAKNSLSALKPNSLISTHSLYLIFSHFSSILKTPRFTQFQHVICNILRLVKISLSWVKDQLKQDKISQSYLKSSFFQYPVSLDTLNRSIPWNLNNSPSLLPITLIFYFVVIIRPSMTSSQTVQ